MGNITKINGNLITAESASFATSASFVATALSSSFATSASYVRKYSGILVGNMNSFAAVAGTIYGAYLG